MRSGVRIRTAFRAELEKELAVRDAISEGLADQSRDGIIPQFKAAVWEQGKRSYKVPAHKTERTFKNGQNAKGEFVANILIDLTDSESEWWTGRHNHAILGMSKTDDTEFRQFYQEIEKRTKNMDDSEGTDH